MADQRYEASRETVGALLSTTSPKIVVPEWQRSYSWDTIQVEAFWADLLAFDSQYSGENIKNQEYFLGSIVLVTGGDSHLLLDGQQRLATATILLSVLRDARKLFKADSASRLNSKYISDYDDASESTTYVLTLNGYDRDFFRSEIQNDPLPARRLTPTLKSHARIRKARQYFERELEKLQSAGSTPKEKFERNLRIGKVLTDHISMVVVTSSDEDNASAVFETLNDRGIGLSTSDLLRNLLIRLAADQGARDAIVSAWQSILSLEGDVAVDQLLRHYWVSVRGDVKARALYREMKDVISKERIDSLVLSQEIAEAALDYKDLISCATDNPMLADALEAIRTLGASVLYPALLSGCAIENSSQEGLALLASALVSLYVRHSVIGGRESTVLEQTVFKTAANLRVTRDFDAAIAELRRLAPGTNEFEERFARASISRAATARYLLRKLEEHLRTTEELGVFGSTKVHLEHIYPQTPLPGEKLENHASVLNLLGNLTLLSRRLNVSVKNASFDTKKMLAYDKSEILLTRSLVSITSGWDLDKIRTRQKELAKHAASIWSLSGEDRGPSEGETFLADQEAAEVELPEIPASSTD